MKDQAKTKQALIEELIYLRRRVAERSQPESRATDLGFTFESFFRKHAAIMLLMDGETGRFIDANDAALAFYGYSIDHMKSMKVGDINNLSPEILDTERQRAVKEDRKYFIVPHRLANGNVRTVEVRTTPILSANKTYLFSVVHDITDLKRTQEDLQKSEENFRRSLDDSPLGVRIMSAKGETIYANRAILDIYGYGSIDELKATPAIKQYTADSFANNQVKRGKREGSDNLSSEYEVQILRKDGEVRHLHVFHKEILWNGEIQFQIIYQNITERKRVEEALRLTRISMERASDAIFWITPQARIVDCNEAACRSLGYTREDLLQLSVPDIDIHYTAEMWPQHHAELKLLGSLTFETDHRTKDGRLFPVEVVANYVPFGSKELNCAFVRDITDRKQAEEALRESEERYRSLFANNHAVMYLIDPDNAAIMDANPAACAYYGWSREEFVKRRIDEINILKKEKVAAELQLARSSQRNHFFFKHRLSDGIIRDVEIYSGPIVLDGKTLLYSIVHDVTDRKKAEQELQLHSEIMTNMSEGIILIQVKDSIIVYANPKFEEMFNYDTGELTGSHVSVVNVPDGKSPKEKALDIISQLHEHGSWRGEVYCRKKDQTPFWCYANISTFNHAEYGEVWIAVYSDITERKNIMAELDSSYQQLRLLNQRWVEIEELERKRLSAELHDEIGQNMTALGINFTVAKMSLPPGTDPIIHDRIDESINLLKRTTAQIKGIMSNLRPTILDEYGLVPALRWHVQESAKRTGIELAFSADELPCRPAAEIEIALFRIAQEAINNAVKHAGANHISMTLNYVKNSLCLEIVDDGAGFEMQAIQGQDSPGWGMMIMRERCLGVKGRFHVESMPRQGTRISVEVPL